MLTYNPRDIYIWIRKIQIRCWILFGLTCKMTMTRSDFSTRMKSNCLLNLIEMLLILNLPGGSRINTKKKYVLKFSICCHPVNMTDNRFLDIKNFCLNPFLTIPMYRDLYLWYVVSNKLNLLLPSNWIYCSLSCCRLLSYNTSVVFKVSVENSLLRWSYMYNMK